MPAAETLRALLDAAYRSMGEDAGAAERSARAVSALIRAERDLAEFIAASAPRSPEEDADTIRAELRSRFRRLVEAEHAGVPDAVLKRIAAGSPAQ
jgi:hypothetical protein